MQVAQTAPDDVLTSAIIPVQPLVDFLTLRAKNDLRKSVIGAEPAFSAVLGAPPRHFLLHSQKYILRNDRFMVVLNVVLRQSAVVLATLLVQEVYGVGLLQERVTHVLLVFQYLPDGAVVPARIAPCGADTVTLQPSGDLLTARTLKILPEDTLDDLSLCRIDDQMPRLVLVIAEEVPGVYHYFPLLEAVLNTHFRILAERLRFLLCQRCHYCE